VDTPTREELIASSNTPEENLQIPRCGLAGLRSLQRSGWPVSDNRSKFCTSCYTGVYPTDLVQLEVRESVPNGKSGESVLLETTVETGPAERPVVVERES